MKYLQYSKKITLLFKKAVRGAGTDLKRSGLVLFLCFLPIAYLLIFDAESFVMAWNQGRGGFLFAFVLLTAEFFAERRNLEVKKNKKNITLSVIISGLVLTYFILATFGGLTQYLSSMGQLLGVPSWQSSWIWAWDYLVFALYIAIVLGLLCGAVGIKSMVTAIIYSIGMAVILLLDSFFPYDTLGPLQSIVPVMLIIDLFLLKLAGVEQALVHSNILVLPTSRGPFHLAVFWPSAGVHSMIIYSLIMLAFLIKIPLSWSRKLLFFTLGSVGTFFVNVLRIFFLSAYVVFVSSEVAKFEEFHATIGEIMF